jgi:orotate phosphoribosyltransferase
MDLSTLKRDYIEAVYRTKAFMIKKEPFDLQSGGKSHLYLNHRHFLVQQAYLDLVARTYLKLLEGNAKDYKLCAVDSTMSPVIVGAMSLISGKDMVIVKSKKAEHGTKEDLYGEFSGEIVIIDDMSSTGGTLLEAARKIREKGATTRYGVVSACRDQTAHRNLAKEGIRLLNITFFKEIIDELKPSLSPGEQEIVLTEFPE